MERDEILDWLRTDDGGRRERLWRRADRVRKEAVGDAVHLRGLIEFGNRCERSCLYCGLRAPNLTLERYALDADTILDRAAEAARRGYGTVVLQSGEDHAVSADWLAGVVARVVRETGLAVTLSVGERPEADYALWRWAGASRYLLRFESSDPTLMQRLHPPRRDDLPDRVTLLRRLRALGYEIGGGGIVGLPGQSLASLADDIQMFAALDLDMVGVGPFVPHPHTPLGELPSPPASLALTVLALARLVCPTANIPSSTALASVAGGSHVSGLRCGANVIMPNLTPLAYRHLYDIYPTKLRDPSADEHGRGLAAIAGCGRTVGRGPGHRRRS